MFALIKNILRFFLQQNHTLNTNGLQRKEYVVLLVVVYYFLFRVLPPLRGVDLADPLELGRGGFGLDGAVEGNLVPLVNGGVSPRVIDDGRLVVHVGRCENRKLIKIIYIFNNS